MVLVGGNDGLRQTCATKKEDGAVVIAHYIKWIPRERKRLRRGHDSEDGDVSESQQSAFAYDFLERNVARAQLPDRSAVCPGVQPLRGVLTLNGHL